MGLHMNMNQIRWFCLAYELGSFSKAAEATFVSRQAFGKAIVGMEGELGSELFERSAAGVRPTEFARSVYPDFRTCLNTYEKILASSSIYRMHDRRKIRLVLADGIAASLPEDFLPNLQDSFPEVDFVIEKHFVTRCFELLEQNRADFAICSHTGAPRNLTSIPIVSYPIYVVVDRGLVDFPIDQPTYRDLARFRFFLLGDDFPDDIELKRLFAENGFELQTASQYNDYDLITQQVLNGKGAALATGPTMRRFDETNVVALPFPEPDRLWDIGLHYREDRLSATEREIVRMVRRMSPAG